ncbi:hypothetical protein BGZ63DRAFT_317394, partial [Mariannaea sp. PMI_226]
GISNPILAIKGLPVHHGFACIHCTFLTTSWKLLKVHGNELHDLKRAKSRAGSWASVQLQTFFTGPKSAIRYFCVTANT